MKIENGVEIASSLLNSQFSILNFSLPIRPRSSAGQSNSLLSCGSQVRVLPGTPARLARRIEDEGLRRTELARTPLQASVLKPDPCRPKRCGSAAANLAAAMERAGGAERTVPEERRRTPRATSAAATVRRTPTQRPQEREASQPHLPLRTLRRGRPLRASARRRVRAALRQRARRRGCGCRPRCARAW